MAAKLTLRKKRRKIMVEKRMYIVYKRIAPDGRIYIGCTAQTLIKRSGADGSGYHDNAELWEAIQKFGWENFVSEVLLETEDAKLAAETETRYIKQYNTIDPRFGFNKRIQSYITDEDYANRLSRAIREGTTEESKKQRSESIKRFYANPENREFHRQRVLRAITKPEVREKLRRANAINNAKPEVKAKIKATLLRYWNPERRAEHGSMIREKLSSDEVRKRISEGTKAGLASPEVRAKMSKVQYEKWSNPEYKARTVANMKAACNTPEHKAKMSRINKEAQNRPEVKEKISKAFSGLIFINNGVTSKRVRAEEAEQLIATGNWVRGRMRYGPRSSVKKLQNRIWVNKDGISKFISEAELDDYLDAGWNKGRGPLPRKTNEEEES